MIALEVLLLFVALLFAALVYRWLIHSKWFARLLGGCSPEETNNEIIDGLDRAESLARQRATEAQATALDQQAVAKTLRRRVKSPRPSDPFH
jgi:hypothetical protein